MMATWVENPYWQYFCGDQYFCHYMLIDPSLMTGFRHRIGQKACEFILGLTMQTGQFTKTIKAASLSVVNLNTTVQDRAVAFPIDASCLIKPVSLW
jgi:IS5 family transposase